MSRPAARRLLFAIALFTVPVPFYLGEPELAPVARLAFFTGLLASVLAVEGGGTLAALVGLGAVQTLALGGLLLAGAAGVAWSVDRLHARALRRTVLLAIALGLVGVSLTPVYDTPLSSSRLRSSVLQLFE